MIKTKKYIKLSTFIGVITGVLILVVAILFAIFNVDDSNEQTSNQIERDILGVFDSNDSIYIHKNTLSPELGYDEVIFPIVIHNIYDTKREFQITVEASSDFREFLETEPVKQLNYVVEPFEISSRQKHVEFVIVPVKNMPKNEQYSLTLFVEQFNGSDFVLHGNPRILYVNT